MSCVVYQLFAVLCGQNEAAPTAHDPRGDWPLLAGLRGWFSSWRSGLWSMKCRVMKERGSERRNLLQIVFDAVLGVFKPLAAMVAAARDWVRDRRAHV